MIDFWATVCKTVLPMLWESCLSVCLSVCLRRCCIVAKRLNGSRCHFMQVGIGPGHTVLDGEPAPPTQKKGAQPLNFRPMSIAAKRLNGPGCHLARGRPLHRPHCVRWGPAPPHQKRGTATPNFGPMSIVAKRSLI